MQNKISTAETYSKKFKNSLTFHLKKGSQFVYNQGDCKR